MWRDEMRAGDADLRVGDADLRVGDAERDAATKALHDHFAQGRLDQEELGQRVDAVLAARTVGDLRGVMRDLPVDVAAVSGSGSGFGFGPGSGVGAVRARRFRPLAGLLMLGLVALPSAMAFAVAGVWLAAVVVIRVFMLFFVLTLLFSFLRRRRRGRGGSRWGGSRWSGPPWGGPRWGGSRWGGPSWDGHHWGHHGPRRIGRL